MKKTKQIIYINTMLILMLLLSIPSLAQDNRGVKLHLKRIALIIGNNSYQTAPLKNPINDAEDMAANLKKLGFKVILRRNVDQRTMEDAIRHFGNQLKYGGVGFFYFAGHGIQARGRNYLIPIDARIESESDVKYEAIDAGRVLGKMEDAGNQLNIVILDACRNNPYERTFRTDQRGLARMDAPTGSIIAYATAPGRVAADGPERNGVFTKYLMKHMIEPNLPIEQVLKRVRIDVARETNGRQIPWESSSLMGEFYFNPVKAAEVMNTSELSSPVYNQKETLAVIPKTKEKNMRSDSRYKLAIFPWRLTGTATRWNSIAVDGLNNTLRSNQQKIAPVYSFYDLKIKPKPQRLTEEMISENLIKQLWSGSGGQTPNVDLVCQQGKILGVDAVFMSNNWSKPWDPDPGTFKVFLIDIRTAQMYPAGDVTQDFEGNGEHKFEQLSGKIFAEYMHHHKADIAGDQK